MLNTILYNWQSILVAIVVIAALCFAAVKFLKSVNRDKIIKWLVWACSMAEKELGSGTGKLKLVSVYNLFVEKFPWLSTFITFAEFSDMVTQALDEMKKMIETNKAISDKIIAPESE